MSGFVGRTSDSQISFTKNERRTQIPFQPLSDRPTAFRLLKVIGRDDNGFIDCTLRESLIENAEYIALSHVWGTESASYRISLEGQPFWVRPNLYQFLCYAVETFLNVDVWIDALCIDQDDIIDKNRQIQNMGSIFSGAVQVIGYLAGLITPAIATPISGQTDGNILGAQLLAEAIAKDESFKLRGDTELGALLRLVEHEYWHRLWIVQEINLAREVKLHWEGQVILWSSLRRTLSNISHSPEPDISPLDAAIVKLLGTPQHRKLPIFEFVSETEGPSLTSGTSLTVKRLEDSLLDLVLRYQGHKSALLHDRVYALRGLARDGSHLQPDYGQNTFELFLSVLFAAAPSAGFPVLAKVEALGKLLGIDPKKQLQFKSLGTIKASTSKTKDRAGFELCQACFIEAPEIQDDIIYVPDLKCTFLSGYMDHFDIRNETMGRSVTIVSLQRSASHFGLSVAHSSNQREFILRERPWLPWGYHVPAVKSYLEIANWDELRSLLHYIWKATQGPVKCQQ